jgi:hypothetical protein
MKNIKMSKKVANRLQWSVASFISLFLTSAVAIWLGFYDVLIYLFILAIGFNIYLISKTLIEKGRGKWTAKK